MITLLLAALVVAIGDGLPVRAPASAGMSAARLKVINHLVSRGISAGGFPGAAVLVGRNGVATWEKGYGRLDWSSRSPRVSPTNTLYDLASLTKVVATTTAIMILYDEGKLSLDDPVARYLPTFTGGGKERVTIRLLLEHRSGLPADRALWRIADSPAEARQDVLDTPLRYAPGERYVYSDLGFDLLGFIVQAVSHEPLDQFVETHVFQPLGMRNTFFRPPRSVWARTAPTEVNPPRGYPLQGQVHDENAYALGGVAGHAGLFSTASDLAIFAQMMLNGGEYHGIRIVADSTVRRFTTRAIGSQALGWAMADGQWGSGEYLGEDAFGHVGYTGTSLWIDPDRQMFVILLTNRVHAPRARHPATVIEDVRADLCDAASLAVVDDPDQVIAMPVAFRADLERGWNPRRHRTHRRRPSHTSGHRAPAHSPAARADAKGSRKVTR